MARKLLSQDMEGEAINMNPILYVPYQKLPQVLLGESLMSGQTFVVENPEIWRQDSYRTIAAVPYQPFNKIYSFDTNTLQDMDHVNQRLAEKGLPPVDIASVTKEIEDITHNTHLTDKDKRRMINTIRKRLGLKKGEMKRLFTKRLEKLYGEMIHVAEIQGVKGPELEQLKQTKSLYHSMYKAGGCIKKMFKGIGNFFKGVATSFLGFAKGLFNPRNWFRLSFWRDVIAPVALSFVPALGPVAGTLYRWGMRGLSLMGKMT